MKYDFDRHVDRKNTNDMKWHTEAVKGYLGRDVREDMIPMWIADTEFACPPVIVDALRKRVEKEIYGYCAPGPAFYKAISWWMQRRFDWTVDPSWITVCPAVVASINTAVHAFTQPGDGVIVQQPVFDPFMSIVERSGRVVVNNGLVLKEGRYEMDYELLEKQAACPENKMLVLCSPHNPVGRVWTKEELTKLAEICLKNDVMIVADEIHSDIVYSGSKHTPLLSLDERYQDAFIYLNAPGKTFNISGLKVSYAIIPNPQMKAAFDRAQKDMSLDVRSTFGLDALAAAYTPEGEEWMLEELEYLEANARFAEQFVRENIPGGNLVKPEGCFLCWLDLSGTGLSDNQLLKAIVLDEGIICVPGTWFGKGGEGHIRLNIGCPRDILTQALQRIAKAVAAAK